MDLPKQASQPELIGCLVCTLWGPLTWLGRTAGGPAIALVPGLSLSPNPKRDELIRKDPLIKVLEVRDLGLRFGVSGASHSGPGAPSPSFLRPSTRNPHYNTNMLPRALVHRDRDRIRNVPGRLPSRPPQCSSISCMHLKLCRPPCRLHLFGCSLGRHIVSGPLASGTSRVLLLAILFPTLLVPSKTPSLPVPFPS